MGNGRALGLAVVAALAGGCAGLGTPEETAPPAAGTTWRDHFEVDRAKLAATGRNAWLTMVPGRVLELAEDGNTLRITVLPETKVVDGVTCGILEERETKKGQLIEVSRNFFATDPTTLDVYYFGEDVDIYEDGAVASHGGAWKSGSEGAHFGLMLPARPVVGAKWYQEHAPGVALDRAEVLALDKPFDCPAGKFTNCLEIRETSPLEPGAQESKVYASGVGLLKDGSLRLVRYGKDSR